MTQKELLAKCSERDQAFYDRFHFFDLFRKDLDIKSFTELIDPDQVPYTSLVDYHIVVNRHGEVFHTFLLEARDMDDATNFYRYLRDEILEPGTIANYFISQVSDTASFGYYQLTLTIA